MNKNKTNLSIVNNAGVRVKPNIIIGEQGSFLSGDILDANAVEKLIMDKVNEIINGTEEQEETIPNNVIKYTATEDVWYPHDVEEIGWTDPDTDQSILVKSVFENGVGTLTFAKDLTYIPMYLFSSFAQYLTSITIPSTVTYIDTGAFFGCTNLDQASVDNILALGPNAFTGPESS